MIYIHSNRAGALGVCVGKIFRNRIASGANSVSRSRLFIVNGYGIGFGAPFAKTVSRLRICKKTVDTTGTGRHCRLGGPANVSRRATFRSSLGVCPLCFGSRVAIRFPTRVSKYAAISVCSSANALIRHATCIMSKKTMLCVDKLSDLPGNACLVMIRTKAAGFIGGLLGWWRLVYFCNAQVERVRSK